MYNNVSTRRETIFFRYSHPPFSPAGAPVWCEVHVCLLARCPDFHIRPMCPILEMYFEITERLAWT
jgi:hypothetical protein